LYSFGYKIIKNNLILQIQFSAVLLQNDAQRSAAWRGCELGNRVLPAKIKFLAERKREFTAKFAILPNACYAFVVFSIKIVKCLIATFSRL